MLCLLSRGSPGSGLRGLCSFCSVWNALPSLSPLTAASRLTHTHSAASAAATATSLRAFFVLFLRSIYLLDYVPYLWGFGKPLSLVLERTFLGNRVPVRICSPLFLISSLWETIVRTLVLYSGSLMIPWQWEGRWLRN